MRTKLASTVLGLMATAVMVIACQPMLDSNDGRRATRAVSAEGRETQQAGEREPQTSATTRSATTTSSPVTTTNEEPTSAGPPGPRPDSPGGDIEHHWYGTGPRVLVMGDSLTVQARSHLREMADGRYALKVGALSGEGMSGGALSVNLPDPIMPAVAEEYAEEHADVVVLALGTNDAWQSQIGPATFEREWHTATRRFQDACLVGVTVTETERAWLYDAVEARQINRVIRRTVDVVVDWNSEGASSRYTDGDYIHLTSEGRERFADLIVNGVETCLDRR